MIHLQFRVKDRFRLGWILIGGITAAAIISQDIFAFKKFYNIWNVLLIVIFVYWIFLFIKHFKKEKTIASIFLICASFMLFSSVNLVLITFSDYFNAFSISPVLILLLYISAIIFLIIVEISKHKVWLKTENAKLEQLYNRSISDHKTGVYTSEYVRQVLEQTSDFPFSVCMFDVDDFKKINDTYGHFVGDEALLFIADTLKNELRKEDVIGRFGGDEFIILFKNLASQEALQIMDRIVKRFLNVTEKPYKITISAGLYEIDTEESVYQILKNVDDALYRAKESGKNRIDIYEKTGKGSE
jgi:diguanylate cyclase (GGDEF)-like protein